jgi:hypothetical protein
VVTSQKLKPLDLLKFDNGHLGVHLGDVGISGWIVRQIFPLFGQEIDLRT